MPLVTQMLARIEPGKVLATILHFVNRHLNEIDESYFSEASEIEEVAKTLSEDATSIV